MTGAADLPVGSAVVINGRYLKKQPPDTDPWVANHPWMEDGIGRRSNEYVDELIGAGARVMPGGSDANGSER